MVYRTALVTGASSGLGAIISEQLAARGIEVALMARRREALDQVAAKITNAGGRCRTYALDLSDPHAATRAVQAADDALGGLDLVIANAGISRIHPAATLTWEACEALLRTNIDGAVATLVACLPRMCERRRGHLVGISSLAQYRGLPRSAAYSASKAFLSTFLEGLRCELRGTGVAVTDVRPGFVRTPMTASNRFRMPFLMDAEPAAARIVAGILQQKAVVAFPWPMVGLVRGAMALPASTYDRAVRRFRRDEPQRQAE